MLSEERADTLGQREGGGERGGARGDAGVDLGGGDANGLRWRDVLGNEVATAWPAARDAADELSTTPDGRLAAATPIGEECPPSSGKVQGRFREGTGKVRSHTYRGRVPAVLSQTRRDTM